MSSSKRPSLAERMQRVAKPEPAEQATPSSPTSSPAVEGSGGGFHAATRVGKKKITAPLSEEAHKEFRKLAVDLGKKGEALLIEALNDLFQKYRRPPIA